MKQIFIMWGIGKRGKRMIDILGRESIEAFIDSDPQYKDQTYMGKPFIDLDTYMKYYSFFPIMITPSNNKEILKILYKKNIWRYVFPEDIANF